MHDMTHVKLEFRVFPGRLGGPFRVQNTIIQYYKSGFYFFLDLEVIFDKGLKLFRELHGNNLYSWKELTSMDKYKEYYLEISPLPAQKKNRLVFKRPITWKAEGSEKTMTTWEEVLTLDLAPLQQDLVMKALSLFRAQEPKL